MIKLKKIYKLETVPENEIYKMLHEYKTLTDPQSRKIIYKVLMSI